VHESITIYNDLRAEETGIDVLKRQKYLLLEASRKYLTRKGYKAEVSYSFIDKELIKVTQNRGFTGRTEYPARWYGNVRNDVCNEKLLI
jgi:hypothetical protein